MVVRPLFAALVVSLIAAYPANAAFVRSFDVGGTSFNTNWTFVNPNDHGLALDPENPDNPNGVTFSVRNEIFNSAYNLQFEILGPGGHYFLSSVYAPSALPHVYYGPSFLYGDYRIRAWAVLGETIFDLTFADALTPPPPTNQSSVPLPSAFAMLVAGLFGLCARRISA